MFFPKIRTFLKPSQLLKPSKPPTPNFLSNNHAVHHKKPKRTKPKNKQMCKHRQEETQSPLVSPQTSQLAKNLVSLVCPMGAKCNDRV